jgi:uncharacterized membrane protein
MKLLVILLLLAIVASLAFGLFFLVKDGGNSKRMVKALTVRVSLSVTLILMLFIAWAAGLIEPHGAGIH